MHLSQRAINANINLIHINSNNDDIVIKLPTEITDFFKSVCIILHKYIRAKKWYLLTEEKLDEQQRHRRHWYIGIKPDVLIDLYKSLM